MITSNNHIFLICCLKIFRINNHSHTNYTPANPMESILSEAIKLEYATYSPISPSSSQSRELNEAERAKLSELVSANKALLTPVEEDLMGNEFKEAVKVNLVERKSADYHIK